VGVVETIPNHIGVKDAIATSHSPPLT
jgi:hypothetical protein